MACGVRLELKLRDYKGMQIHNRSLNGLRGPSGIETLDT